MKIITTTPEELDELIKKSVRQAFSELNICSAAPTKPLTVDQAALYLNVPKPTLYLLTSQRSIPFRKVGRRLTFLTSELDNWLQENRRKTRSEIENQCDNTSKIIKRW